ncbi:MAG: hypothetical protein V1739_00795 [Candidatus Omnitrophota bacterium]
MNKKLFLAAGLIVIYVFCSFVCTLTVYAQEKFTGEIIIQVNENIISLPEGEAAVVPIEAARVRSSELRDINQEYNARSIEKVYMLEETVNNDKGLKMKKFKNKESGEDKVALSEGTLKLENVFTKKIKQEKIKEGKKVIQVDNVYIIGFEFDKETNMPAVASAYERLPVVISAQHIIRSE